MGFKIKHIMNNGAPEKEVRDLLDAVKNDSFGELYAEVKSYKVSYDNATVKLKFVDTKDRYFTHMHDFLISGLLSEGADAIENNDKLQFLTNAYSGFGENDIIDALNKNIGNFKNVQIMYLWIAPISK